MPSVAAVVSLFNATDDVLANAAALLSQVDTVVVVDDGSPVDSSRILTELTAMGCTVMRMTENSGIAAALNRGISVALSGDVKPDYILTMDQDSLLEEGYVESLLTAAVSATDAGIPIGMVAPASIRGLPTRRAGTMNGIQLGGEPIQSGLLLPVPVIEKLGMLRGDLFIDGVDSEYFLRCLSAGLRTVIAPNAALGHSLGTMTQARVLGRDISLSGRPMLIRTAATWRYYYIFRNRVLLARQYGRMHAGWALKGILADIRHLAIVTVLAPGRRERLINAMSGITQGFCNVTGKRVQKPRILD